MNPSSTARKAVREKTPPPSRRGVAKLFRGILEAAAGVTPEVRARFEDEGLCRRCGRCCYSAIRVHDRMVMLKDLPCKYLLPLPDQKTVCAVYVQRELTGWCHKLGAESVRKELYPPSCPYMEGINHYQGKIELPETEFEQIKPILKKIFHGFPRPEYVKKSDWQRFLHQTLGLPENK